MVIRQQSDHSIKITLSNLFLPSKTNKGLMANVSPSLQKNSQCVLCLWGEDVEL